MADRTPCDRFAHRPNDVCSECGRPRHEDRLPCQHCGLSSANAPDMQEIWAVRAKEIQKGWPWWRKIGFMMAKDVPEYEIPCATEVTDHRRRNNSLAVG